MNDMKPTAEEFRGPPIYCPNDACDFITTSQRGLRFKGFLCPKCGVALKRRMVLAPNFGNDIRFSLSCVNCVNFESTTICTGFGAKLEGRCEVYYAGICSYDTVCGAIDIDPDECTRDVVRALVILPRNIVDMAIEVYNVNSRAMKLPKKIVVATIFPLGDNKYVQSMVERTDERDITIISSSDVKRLQLLLWLADWKVTDKTEVKPS